MASWLVRVERAGLEPWLGTLHCVVLLGKTLYSHSASRHPGVIITKVFIKVKIQNIRLNRGTGKFNAGGNPAMD